MKKEYNTPSLEIEEISADKDLMSSQDMSTGSGSVSGGPDWEGWI